VKTNGKVPRLALAAATAVIVLVCAAGIVLIRRYQALVEDEPEVTLSPTIADVTYCTVDGTALTLDLYLPSSAFSAPHPLLVYIHGGSFTAGDKRKGSGVVDIPAMTERGYAVAAVNYRLMPRRPILPPCRIAGARSVFCALVQTNTSWLSTRSASGAAALVAITPH
jgi:acetyl esterase/lipase